MTPEQAQDVVNQYRVWPFQRLTPEQVKELEQAYNVLRTKQKDALFEQLGEGRF